MALEQITEEGGSKCTSHPTQPRRQPFDVTDRAAHILHRLRTHRQRVNSTVSRPFPRPPTGRIAVKVINHYGDEILKVYGV
jgi:hypothetical protein